MVISPLRLARLLVGISGGGGLYWLVPALVLALVSGALNAWLLLLRLPS